MSKITDIGTAKQIDAKARKLATKKERPTVTVRLGDDRSFTGDLEYDPSGLDLDDNDYLKLTTAVDADDDVETVIVRFISLGAIESLVEVES